MSERTADETGMPEDHPPAEELFAERVARLVRPVERWHARVETERWPAVPLAGLSRDDPRRGAAELQRRMRVGPGDGERAGDEGGPG